MNTVFRALAAVFLVAVAAVASGCSALGLINKASPDAHYDSTRDITYGSEQRQLLDVHTPKQAPDENAAVVVFFYGGGWRDGSKDNYEFVASALTQSGYTVVIPDYRLYPDVVFPTFVEDGAEAIAWVVDNIHQYAAADAPIFLMGHSAGAHIAASLAFDPRYLDKEGTSTKVVRGFIGLSGPYDFLPIQRGYLEEVFPESLRPRSQPVRYVSSAAPSTLLIHGDDDSTVRISNSRSLRDRLQDCGVNVELKSYPGVGHARVVAAIAPPLDFLARTMEDTSDFIERTLTQTPESHSGNERCAPKAISY